MQLKPRETRYIYTESSISKNAARNYSMQQERLKQTRLAGHSSGADSEKDKLSKTTDDTENESDDGDEDEIDKDDSSEMELSNKTVESLVNTLLKGTDINNPDSIDENIKKLKNKVVNNEIEIRKGLPLKNNVVLN